jgi:hypothetical protein
MGIRPHFTLSELQSSIPGTGPKKPPSTNIAQLIGRIGRAQIMVAMEPVGF